MQRANEYHVVDGEDMDSGEVWWVGGNKAYLIVP